MKYEGEAKFTCSGIFFNKFADGRMFHTDYFKPDKPESLLFCGRNNRSYTG